MESNEALVTGGAGFIGSSIVRNLIGKGWDVTVIDDFSTNRTLLSSDILEGVNELIKYDLSNPAIKNKFQGKRFDYVFNFGSYSSDRNFERDAIDATNKTINGMLNTLQIARQCKASAFVYPSSGTVYGNTPAPQKESQFLAPQTLYSITKIYLELLSKINKDINTVALRIFTGFGAREIFKGNLASVVTQFTLSVLAHDSVEIYGDGNQKRDFIESEDIAEIAIRASLNRDAPPVLNAGTGYSYSFNDLVKLIAKHTNIEPNVKYVESKTRFVSETRADTSVLENILKYNPKKLEVAYVKYFQDLKQLL